MKIRWVPLILVGILFFSFTGCALPEQNPIEKIQNILVAGIDIENGQIKLTIVTDKISGGGAAGQVKVGAQVYSATGDTVFEAFRAVQANAEKRLFLPHLKFIVIGEEAAKKDIKDVIDIFSENYQTRLTHKLMIAKGMSAAEFFSKVVTTDGGFWSDLDALFKESKKTGQSSEIRLLDYASNSESQWSDPFIPTVQIIPSTKIENSDAKEENKGPAYLMVLSGYALIKDNRLVGFLDGPQAIGLNIVVNKLKNTDITITDIHGKPVSLEVVKSNASIQTDSSDMASATIRVVFESYLLEYHEVTDTTTDEYIQYLEAQQNKYMQDIITSSLSEAQRCQTDVFGIGSALYHAHPMASETIRDRWKELFPKVNVSIQVQSTIQNTYTMRESMGK